jgi:hypothetical protein
MAVRVIALDLVRRRVLTNQGVITFTVIPDVP